MKLVLASENENKARELRDVLSGWTIAVLGRPLPEETGETFADNARAKAEFGRRHAGAASWVAGEDSGLEVDALAARPGVRSARYAGEGATDAENVEKLLGELAGVPEGRRRARYVCHLVALALDGREVAASGTLSGTIARAPRGAAGFGYDPVFVPDGEELTVAELGDRWKAARSHRAIAARALARSLNRAAGAL